MISETIQAVLEQVCDSYGTAISSDVVPATPFCVHEEKIAATLRDKAGIYGCEFDLTVVIVGDDDAQVDPIVETIIETIELLSDSLVDEATFETSSGLQWDNDTKKFHNILSFKVVTNNL